METFNSGKGKASLNGLNSDGSQSDSQSYDLVYARRTGDKTAAPGESNDPSSLGQRAINICHGSYLAFRMINPGTSPQSTESNLAPNQIGQLSLLNTYFRNGPMVTYFFSERVGATRVFDLGTAPEQKATLDAIFNKNGDNQPLVMIARLPNYNASTDKTTYVDEFTNQPVVATEAQALVKAVMPDGSVKFQVVNIYTPGSWICNPNANSGFFD